MYNNDYNEEISWFEMEMILYDILSINIIKRNHQ